MLLLLVLELVSNGELGVEGVEVLESCGCVWKLTVWNGWMVGGALNDAISDDKVGVLAKEDPFASIC